MTTASKISPAEPADWPGPRMSHADFTARLMARRAETGEPALPRNAGKNRTPAKRALLKAIEDAGGQW